MLPTRESCLLTSREPLPQPGASPYTVSPVRTRNLTSTDMAEVPSEQHSLMQRQDQGCKNACGIRAGTDVAITWTHVIVYWKCLVQAGKHRWYEARDELVPVVRLGYTTAPTDVRAVIRSKEPLDRLADDRESSMVCPACLTAMVVSQLPTIASAAVGAAGIKMAYDQKQQPKARDVKESQPVRVLKVCASRLEHCAHSF